MNTIGYASYRAAGLEDDTRARQICRQPGGKARRQSVEQSDLTTLRP